MAFCDPVTNQKQGELLCISPFVKSRWKQLVFGSFNKSWKSWISGQNCAYGIVCIVWLGVPNKGIIAQNKSGIGDGNDGSGSSASEETNRCTGFMDMETDTNPIDRSLAHLLFHRP
ncbi:uncharacterized protein [Gossypium hirsutum]|uniref:Uncharacterized protein n=1 Tax=Gossypium hirsutum TaxID=3635 RepID=A0ABM3BHB8_GOSHI|nr:uncharacterized protein LOC121227017 [Gossypium hirsutum]